MSKRLVLLVAVGLIVASSAGIVTIISAQEGAAPGAPADPPAHRSLEAAWAPDRVWLANDGTLYRLSEAEGVLVSEDSGASWQNRSEGLPRRVVWPFEGTQPSIVTSLAVDASDGRRLAITTPEAVWISSSAGLAWERLEVREPLRPNDQLTCVAFAPGGATLAVGTSFHGLFETSNRGRTWIDLTEKVTAMHLGGGNYEEVSAVAYHPAEPDTLYLGLGFGKGLYRLHRSTKAAERVDFPGETGRRAIKDLAFRPAGTEGAWDLEVRTTTDRWLLAASTGAWSEPEPLGIEPPADPAQAERARLAAGKTGIYVSAYKASGKALDSHLAFIKRHDLNSLVVDCKDDWGNVTYDTALELPRKIGAVRTYFSIDELVAKAHAAGLYLIGRIVVFRDRGLYNAPRYPYAAWDRISDSPWRALTRGTNPETGEEVLAQGEYWVDPFSPEVWQYNIDIAREIVAHGVDEVQFDYIRFPSDGDLSRITWRFRREGMGKIEALESFLKAARHALAVPISTDVYGYCGWARISNWVAQSIEVFSRWVDVISPMFYPSHFPREFLGSIPYLERARTIYREGGNRASGIVEGRALIRPYIQAFRLGEETKFSAATTRTYLVNQVLGTLESAASGFTLWNASNDYYMVTVPLGPLVSAAAGIPTVGP